MVRDTSVTFDPTFKAFVDGLSILLNSLYDAVTTLPRAEIELELVHLDTHWPESLKVLCVSYNKL